MNYEVISRNLWWWAELGVAVMNLGPLIALIVCAGGAAMRGRVRLAFVGASLAPLLLNLIGWDNVRWASLCAVTAFINLGLVSRGLGV